MGWDTTSGGGVALCADGLLRTAMSGSLTFSGDNTVSVNLVLLWRWLRLQVQGEVSLLMVGAGLELEVSRKAMPFQFRVAIHKDTPSKARSEARPHGA
jgi:hypothetical protein